jgi:hypothetical protein
VLGPLDERERHPINAVIEERKGQRRALAQLASKKCETDGLIVSRLGMLDNDLGKRPAAVEDLAVPGYWEGDLLSGQRTATSRPWSNVVRVT